jgi:hypothetical protein
MFPALSGERSGPRNMKLASYRMVGTGMALGGWLESRDEARARCGMKPVKQPTAASHSAMVSRLAGQTLPDFHSMPK